MNDQAQDVLKNRLDVRKRVAAAMAEIEHISFDATNHFAKYKYASTDAVFAHIRPILAKHELTVRCSEIDFEYREMGAKQYPFLAPL